MFVGSHSQMATEGEKQFLNESFDIFTLLEDNENEFDYLWITKSDSLIDFIKVCNNYWSKYEEKNVNKDTPTNGEKIVPAKRKTGLGLFRFLKKVSSLQFLKIPFKVSTCHLAVPNFL